MPHAGPLWRQTRPVRSSLPLPDSGAGNRFAGLHDCYRPDTDFTRDGQDSAGTRPPVRFPGLLPAILAGLLLMLSLAGWLVIFTSLFASGSRLDAAAEHREAQLVGIKSTIGDLDAKLGALSDKLQRVGEKALDNIEEIESRDERLNRLESEVQQLRERASSMDSEQAAPPCGAQTPLAPAGSSQQETGDDQRG